jgi:predicted aspartyl protease
MQRKVLLLLLFFGCAPALPARFVAGGEAWRRVQVLETRGTVRLGGLEGTSESIEDVPSGRHRVTTRLGPLQVAQGFDGGVGWVRSANGEIVVQDAPQAIAEARTEAWLTRRGWLRGEIASAHPLGRRENLEGYEVTPAGGAPIDLWFDRKSGRLSRTVERRGVHTLITTFEDYRAVGAVEIPFRTVTDDGDPRNLATVTLSEARWRPALPDAAWTRPHTDRDRIRFTGGATRTEVPIDLVGNHIYVRAAIDGQPVYLLVDTGGANMLTPEAAKRLGMATEGNMAASGAGEGRAKMSFARGRSLTVGAVTLDAPTFYVIDLGPLAKVEGVRLDGLIGFEMFARLAVRIDYSAGRMALVVPAAFTPPPGAIAVPFEVRERMPVVKGELDGVPARFTIDTGSRGAIDIHSPFIREHKLAARYRPRFQTIIGWGVGGAVRGSPVRFGEVKIGGAVARSVVGALYLGDKGAFASPDASANVGGGLLRRFVVTVDYARRRLFLEPIPGRDAPDRFDHAGLFLLRDGDALRIAGVAPGSPAERAGLHVGDQIVAVDRTPIAQRPLADWRKTFVDGEVGTTLVLIVERGGERREVSLTLAEILP